MLAVVSDMLANASYLAVVANVMADASCTGWWHANASYGGLMLWLMLAVLADASHAG